MTIELIEKQLPNGITGDSHTLAYDIRPLSDEKAGTATEPSRPTSLQPILKNHGKLCRKEI